MQLSQTAKYALRIVAQLAAVDEDELVRGTDLAVRTHVPSHYLSKITRQLVQAGLLTSRKGHGGGYALARPAKDISFHDVIESVDDAVIPARCVFGWDECDPERPCPLHPIWSQLKAEYESWAMRHTMNEIVPPRGQASRRA